MFQRRIPLLVCAGLIGLIATIADAGPRKRAFRQAAASCACQQQPKVVAVQDAQECICPVYPWAFRNGYCSYYAIVCTNASTSECKDGTPSTPVNYDAACGLSSSPCTNCIPRFQIADKPNVKVNEKHWVAGEKSDGFNEPVTAPIGVTPTASVKIRDKVAGEVFVTFSNELVSSTIVKCTLSTGGPVWVQLLKVKVKPDTKNIKDQDLKSSLKNETFLVGHQISEQESWEAELTPTLVQDMTFVVKYKNDDYAVILKK